MALEKLLLSRVQILLSLCIIDLIECDGGLRWALGGDFSGCGIPRGNFHWKLKFPCPWLAGGWNWMIFKVPSNLNHSRILWFYKMGISEEGMQDPRAAPSHQSAQPAEQLLKNSNDFTKRSKKNNNRDEEWFTVCPWSGEIHKYSPNSARTYEHSYALGVWFNRFHRQGICLSNCLISQGG